MSLSTPIYSSRYYAVNHAARTVRGPYEQYSAADASRRDGEQIISDSFARHLIDQGYDRERPDSAAAMVAA